MDIWHQPSAPGENPRKRPVNFEMPKLSIYPIFFIRAYGKDVLEVCACNRNDDDMDYVTPDTEEEDPLVLKWLCGDAKLDSSSSTNTRQQQ